MEYLKKIALAQHLGTDTENIEDEIEVSHWDDCTFEAEGGEYLVLTDDEADGRWDEALDNYIEEALAIPNYIRHYFDKNAWKSDARINRRCNSLASYDGVEYEEVVEDTTFYIFRTN